MVSERTSESIVVIANVCVCVEYILIGAIITFGDLLLHLYGRCGRSIVGPFDCNKQNVSQISLTEKIVSNRLGVRIWFIVFISLLLESSLEFLLCCRLK